MSGLEKALFNLKVDGIALGYRTITNDSATVHGEAAEQTGSKGGQG